MVQNLQPAVVGPRFQNQIFICDKIFLKLIDHESYLEFPFLVNVLAKIGLSWADDANPKQTAPADGGDRENVPMFRDENYGRGVDKESPQDEPKKMVTLAVILGLSAICKNVC